MFDSVLVSLMVVETTVLAALTEAGVVDIGDSLGKASILRLLRLLRLTRIGKLMAYIPEIMILIKGMVEGMRSVGLTMGLLLCVIYVVAIALVSIADGTDVGKTYFPTVPEAMYTLLIHGMVPDIGGVMEEMKQEWYIAVTFVVFVFFSTFTVLNMLIGILCEVVSSVKVVEQEQMDIEWLHFTLKKVMVEQIDQNHDGMVSKAEFLMMFDKPMAVDALTQMGFDVVSLVDCGDLLFGDESTGERQLTFEEFIAVLLHSRSTQPATQKDIRELQKFIKEVCDPMRRSRLPTQTKPATLGLFEDAPLAPEPGTLLSEILELRQRMDGLETLAIAQPELAQRMSSLEGHVVDIMETQKVLLERLPSPDLLRKLSESVCLPPQPAFSPPPRLREGRFSSAPKVRPLDRESLTPCGGLLFCAGPGLHSLPSSSMRGLPLAPGNSIIHPTY